MEKSLTLKQKFCDNKIFLIVLIITVFAGAIRFFQLGDHSFWYDEAASVKNVQQILEVPQQGPWGPFSFTRGERVPPLYFFVVVPFYLIANNEWILRLSTVFFGIFSIPLIYFLGKLLVNENVGLISAFLLAISPFHIYYSQELRPYSLFLLLTISAFILFILATRNNNLKYFWLLIITITLGIYTHLYMVFVLALLDIVFLIQWRKYRHLLKRWLMVHILIFILSIPEIYILMHHILLGNTHLADSYNVIRYIPGTIYIFTFGRFFFTNFPNIIFIIIQGVIYAFTVLVLLMYFGKNRKKLRANQFLIFLFSALIIYLAIFLISIIITPLFDEMRVHYLIFLLPMYLILIAFGLSLISSKVLKNILIITILCFSIIINYPYFFQWDQIGRGNFRGAAAFIERNSGEESVVFHTDDRSIPSINYYLHGETQQILINSNVMPEINDLDEFWLVVFHPSSAISYMEASANLQNDLSNSQLAKEKACRNFLDDINFEIDKFQSFNGKNEIFVCHFVQQNK